MKVFEGAKKCFIVLFLGAFLMGDKPLPIVNPNSCPSGNYPDGLQPDSIRVEIQGCSVKPTAPSYMYPPTNGIFNLPFITCSDYRMMVGNLEYWIHFGPTAAYFAVIIGGSDEVYTFDVPYDLPESSEGDLTLHIGHYIAGTIKIDWWLTEREYPESWDAESLEMVPDTDEYFAEEFDSSLHERYLRYAEHRTASNLKIWLGTEGS